jgi:hypothetical protein
MSAGLKADRPGFVESLLPKFEFGRFYQHRSLTSFLLHRWRSNRKTSEWLPPLS